MLQSRPLLAPPCCRLNGQAHHRSLTARRGPKTASLHFRDLGGRRFRAHLGDRLTAFVALTTRSCLGRGLPGQDLSARTDALSQSRPQRILKQR